MTREEQIKKAAFGYADTELVGIIDFKKEAAFIEGATWADTHPHWISVKDELPPLNQDVLVVFAANQVNEVGIDRIIQNIEDNGYEDWELFTGITHWMPLPQAPKKGDEQ